MVKTKTDDKITDNKSLLKWCSVSLTDLIAHDSRMEASVYDIEAKKARQIINSCKYPLTTIGGKKGLTQSYTCARFKRIWVDKSDLPIYQPATIMDVYPLPDGYIKVNENKYRGVTC